MDANFNRAKEAIRVIEDITRFIFEDETVSARLKKVRHNLSRSLLKMPFPYSKFLESREAAVDVGRKGVIRDTRNTRWQDVMIANFKRSQEAMRVLEEISKVIASGRTSDFQNLRFELYELEKVTLRKL